MDRQASFNAGSTLYACADLSQTGQAYSDDDDVYTLHYTSANTMWKIIIYFLRTETFCDKLHLGLYTVSSRLFLKKLILMSVTCYITQQ